ncbi:hypothetical protein MmiAt1_05110 [Methanimicrococcus sp. At1]|uniref:Transmembrane protein n=1 Tax=Methanimicrococcus hacksteinii TaxID=3028293 RepID=A0ABU3VNH7_9EURY|nr:hypothetical protein [Methanimicrococcus sp. At1]
MNRNETEKTMALKMKTDKKIGLRDQIKPPGLMMPDSFEGKVSKKHKMLFLIHKKVLETPVFHTSFMTLSTFSTLCFSTLCFSTLRFSILSVFAFVSFFNVLFFDLFLLYSRIASAFLPGRNCNKKGSRRKDSKMQQQNSCMDLNGLTTLNLSN